MLEVITINSPSSLCLQVVVNVIISVTSSYAKIGIVFQLHADQTNKGLALLMNGVFTQLGSLLGAILFFCLVYFTGIFKQP